MNQNYGLNLSMKTIDENLTWELWMKAMNRKY